MKISWKSFFLSFGVAFVLFAILFAFVFTDIFRDFVPRAERTGGKALVNKTRDSYESYIVYCNDKENEALEFALLARVDKTDQSILVTDLGGNDLVARGESLYYVRSLCEDHGIEELCPIFASLTGYEVKSNRILNARDCLPSAVKGTTVRYLDVMELLPSILEGADGFSVSECALVAEENHGIRVIDMERSLEAFQALK